VRGIPGVFVRSAFTDAEGEPLLRYGSEVVDFRTPFTNRWGGWYVTGKHGAALHRGNATATEKNDRLETDFQRGANVTDLSKFFDPSLYVTNTSDIVALLVLEHQTAMQNALTKASLDSRRMLAYQKNLQRDLKEPITEDAVYESVKSVLDSSARDVVDTLLFRGEAEMPAGLAGSANFQQAFQANAHRAATSRSRGLEKASRRPTAWARPRSAMPPRSMSAVRSASRRSVPASLRRDTSSQTAPPATAANAKTQIAARILYVDIGKRARRPKTNAGTGSRL
jgi:hypothetical protein